MTENIYSLCLKNLINHKRVSQVPLRKGKGDLKIVKGDVRKYSSIMINITGTKQNE